MRIRISSHHFAVYDIQRSDMPILREFLLKCVEYSWIKQGRSFKKQAVCTYASAPKNRSEYRFILGALDSFYRHCAARGIRSESIPVVKRKIRQNMIQRVDLPKTANMHTLHDYQEGVVRDFLDPSIDNPLCTMAPGRGKTLCAIYAMHKLGMKTILIMKGGFIPQWVGELESMLELEEGDLVVAGDTPGLIRIMRDNIEDPSTSKIILVANGLMRNYIKDMEAKNYKSKKYPCKPDDFYESMGIGLVIRDEVHMEFHSVYRQFLYQHVYKSISLSATFMAKAPVASAMMEYTHPLDVRNDGGGIDKYIKVTAVEYGMLNGANIRCAGSMGYNHTVFENSIMQKPKLRKRYFDLIHKRFNSDYFIRRTSNDHKCMVFFATVDMCESFVEYLSDIYPRLTINKYTAEDPESHLYESDVVVTTIGSAGTGKDVRGLITTILTVSIDSPVAVVQTTGRLRKPKDGTEMRLVYLYCRDIKKQVDYHHNKPLVLDERVMGITLDVMSGNIDEHEPPRY